MADAKKVHPLFNCPTQYDRMYSPLPVSSNVGETLTDDYGYVFDEDGKKHLEIIGHSNIPEKIQAYKDSCDINCILAQFKNGDADILNQRTGMYIDVTQMPKTYAEVLQLVNDATEKFNSFSPEIKEKFNNNADEFWSTYGNAEFMSKMANFGDFSPTPVNEPIDQNEVKGDE